MDKRMTPVVSEGQLLKVLLSVAHDPTQLNRQGFSPAEAPMSGSQTSKWMAACVRPWQAYRSRARFKWFDFMRKS